MKPAKQGPHIHEESVFYKGKTMNIYKKMKAAYAHSIDPDSFLTKENEWEYLYNMSPVRQNILRWCEFKEGEKLLELGAGTGIITEFFSSQGLAVTPVENDPEKQEILRTRFRTVGKTDVLLRDITSDKPVDHSYDYVSMIDCFSPEYLDLAVQFLKPTGVIFIAVENKFADPVWSRKEKDDIYSLSELETIIMERGFKIRRIYYPSPDHILPMEIYSEPDDSLSASYLLICESVHRSEEYAKDKLFYAKFNNFRKSQFQTATYIRQQNDGKRYVVKHPITSDAEDIINKMEDTYEILIGEKADSPGKYYKNIKILKGKNTEEGEYFSYLKGESLDSGVDVSKDTLDVIKSKLSYSLDIMFDINDDYFCTFEPTKSFGKIFGLNNITGLKTVASKTGKSIKALKMSNYDSVFGNFMKTDDGVYCLDYEWFFDFPIPFSFLKYRALSVYYHDNESSLLKRASKEEFMKLFGFGELEIAIFDSMEDSFQKYVFGKNRERLYLERYRASNEGHDKRSGLERINKGFHKLHMIGKSKVYNALNHRTTASTDYRNYQERRLAELTAEVEGDYNTWIRKCDSEYKVPSSYKYNPLISVVLYDINDEHGIADKTIDSVKESRYMNYEVTSIGSVSGEYVLFIKRGDTLSQSALSEVVGAINSDSDLSFIYSDEDTQNENGIREAGFMKPDWSEDTFLSSGYTGTMGVFKTSDVKEYIKKCSTEDNFLREMSRIGLYGLVLSVIRKGHVRHIPRVLYHTNGYEVHTDKVLLERFLSNNSIRAEVIEEDGGYLRVNYDLKVEEMVSIIIPSKDNYDALKKCVDSILSKPHKGSFSFEIIIVDNGSTPENKKKVEEFVKSVSDEAGIGRRSEVLGKIKIGLQRFKYIYEPGDFNFSFMCNRGVDEAEGNYLLFLNDDIEASDNLWLTRMLGQAMQPHVGAVGAKLLYPNTKLIQHDGIICRSRNPVHLFSHQDDSDELYFGFNRIDRNVLALTGACLMVEREKFRRVGRFDENLPVAYNDVDLCFKLYESGYSNVLRNDAVLYHHESMSRGLDIDKEHFDRLSQEKTKLYEKHPELEDLDPYYNPYLTRVKTDADYAFERFNVYEVRILQGDENIRRGSNVLCEIDMARLDGDIVIEGWAFEPGSLYNPDMKVEVLLEGVPDPDLGSGVLKTYRSYAVTTTKKRRMDVAEKYKSETAIEFSGFITRFDKALIEEGTYSISILYEDRKYVTPESITI